MTIFLKLWVQVESRVSKLFFYHYEKVYRLQMSKFLLLNCDSCPLIDHCIWKVHPTVVRS